MFYRNTLPYYSPKLVYILKLFAGTLIFILSPNAHIVSWTDSGNYTIPPVFGKVVSASIRRFVKSEQTLPALGNAVITTTEK